MNSRPKLSLPASLALAALLLSACGGGAQEVETADTAALVAAPAAQLLAPEPEAPATARRAFTPVVAPGEGLELAEEAINEKSEKQRYEIDITFPQLKGRVSPNAAKFNRAVRELAEREAHHFKRADNDSKDRHPSGGRAWGEARDTLAGRYEVIHLDDDFVSLRFGFFAYGHGAAHPTQFHRVLNFDLRRGRAPDLDDLFKPGSQHLHALAAHSIADLKRRDEEEHRREVARVTAEGRPASSAGVRTPDSDFQSGAGPEVENYRAWNLAAEGVVVTFAACQVFGCAAGEQEVLVPYSALGEILNESGPAARLNAPQPR
jgi:hypothetical protein